MALVSEKRNFMFFHLYKCGGMSLRHFIKNLNIDTKEIQGGHSCPKDMLELYSSENKKDDFIKSFKFTFIRNPFDFMVSTFFYAKSYTNHFMHNDVVGRNMTMLEFIPYYFSVREQHKDNQIRPLGSNKVVTFKDWLLVNDVCIVDFIGKTENYNKDMKIVCDTIGLSLKDFPKTNVNPNRLTDYQKYYTPESRKLIEQYFEWELNEFNYNF